MPKLESYSDRDVLVGVLLAAVGVFVLSGLIGYYAAEPGHRWELASIFGTALGTTLLAGATAALAYSTRSDVRATWDLAEISQAALDAQVQPLFVDVVPLPPQALQEELIPYEPDHADGSKNVRVSWVDVRVMENGHFACSVPLRNAGAGLAFITDDPRLAHPSRDIDYIGRLTKQVVPPGEETRAYFGPGVPLDTPDDATLIVKVPYTDASQSVSSTRILWTEAIVRKRGNDWRVVRVAIRRDGEAEPFVVSAAAV